MLGLRTQRIDSDRTLINPVTASGTPIYMGDSFAFRANGVYYLVGTTSEHEGFQVYRSVDLAHWNMIGWAIRKALINHQLSTSLTATI
jgi:hypothetical protein